MLGCTLSLLSLADASVILQRRADLEQVQRRIGELERALADAQASRSDAAGKLAAAERAVSAANRRLRQLGDDRAAAEKNLAAQEAERLRVEERIASRQAELAGWLRRHYMHGGNDMALFLSGRDPNQIARDARYVEQVGRARLELIESLRTDLRELEQLVAAIGERRDSLIALEAEQRRQQGELQKVQRARANALEVLNRQIGSQEQQIQALRRNEEELGRVLEVMALRAAEQKLSEAQPSGRAERADPVMGRSSRAAVPTPFGVSFAQLRGKMGFPVRGELIGRFGAPRADGGTKWRGVFIRAGGGEDVVAVAPGEVVFSDWLRGYGNLIIVDHGDDYLTIYGNNDALFKVVGDRIGGGTPIASVGASGGAQESGLYFEIRHKGEPVDPMQWIRAR
jgi:murein hydrolase activator